MIGFPVLKTTRTIDEIRRVHNTSDYSYVLSPIEKECVKRLTDYIIKSPLMQLTLKTKIYEKLS